MEFAEEEDYDKLEPSSYTGDIEFKAQADSEAIEDRTTEDPFRDTWGPDAQNIFAKEDDDDDDSWSESALIQEQLRKIRDRGDRLRADREARLLQQQNPPPPPPLRPPPPSGNHDHDHQYSQTKISSPEEKTPHIFDSSSSFTENMLPRLILLFFFLLLLFSAISTKKFSKPYKSRSKPFPKFIMNKINLHHLPPPLHRLFAKDKKISALPSPPSTKITSRLQFHLLYKKTIFPHLPIIPLPTLQRHCFSLARKFLIGYIFLLLSAPFGKIALASYRNQVVLWRDLEGFEVPYYLLVEEERRGCW
ncbi:uncharacterized protein SEPMUDRAFT_108406 [Sphaerulina musiva SO2202]|uniref:Uncharacterized protein n=1 Tax=Sphaerulina musiva (strain SO2202) TaxID=692275 RepID=M3BY38_SPHMS|nr:uncharacterized protein SEPMUDRAFT_108406 [Sphaerulina musiva SO2202]EMF12976.1 hypothetical protein SEPMUDRAFT_108406 [Sphaerulina musiva SO2202]